MLFHTTALFHKSQVTTLKRTIALLSLILLHQFQAKFILPFDLIHSKQNLYIHLSCDSVTTFEYETHILATCIHDPGGQK